VNVEIIAVIITKKDEKVYFVIQAVKIEEILLQE
jgi:hypothetical protein